MIEKIIKSTKQNPPPVSHKGPTDLVRERIDSIIMNTKSISLSQFALPDNLLKFQISFNKMNFYQINSIHLRIWISIFSLNY